MRLQPRVLAALYLKAKADHCNLSQAVRAVLLDFAGMPPESRPAVQLGLHE